MTYKILWYSLLEALKGISIGLAGGMIVFIIGSEGYTTKQYIFSFLVLVFLATSTNYCINIKLYKNRAELKNIKKHL